MFRRRQPITHGRLAREELTESYGHLRMAAAHAATGAAGAIAPRVDAARQVVGRAARKGQNKVTKKETGMTGRRRWTMIIGGLLATSAAIGAASALIKRRRASQTRWEEYGTKSTSTGTSSITDSTKSTMDAGIDKVSSIAESAKDRASDLIGSTSSTGSPSDLANSSTRDLKQQRDDLYGKPSPSSPATASTGSSSTTTSGSSRNSRP